MLPPKCITCGKLLADIEVEWSTKKELWENDDKLTADQVADKLTALLDKLHIKSQCCRSQVLTFVDLIKIIL
jgi:DNA-directed RNA polymerase subunit N (RpoN/RPB10)